jgi:hypothetical protein
MRYGIFDRELLKYIEFLSDYPDKRTGGLNV